jgi:hypothetical protein
VRPRVTSLEARSRARVGPAPTPNREVRADLQEPWLTGRNRLCPLTRTRRGHGREGQEQGYHLRS